MKKRTLKLVENCEAIELEIFGCKMIATFELDRDAQGYDGWFIEVKLTDLEGKIVANGITMLQEYQDPFRSRWFVDYENPDEFEFAWGQSFDRYEFFQGVCDALDRYNLTEEVSPEDDGFEPVALNIAGIYIKGIGLNKYSNDDGKIRIYKFDVSTLQESSDYISLLSEESYQVWVEQSGKGYKYAEAQFASNLLEAFDEAALEK